jgi:tyrosine-protein phosphatase YwqE
MKGYIYCIASDTHSLKRRPPEIARGLQHATELLGQATLNWLIETNPIAIITNQSLSFEFSSHNKFFWRAER